MTIDELKTHIPDFAKDIKINLSKLLTEEGSIGLTQMQIDVIALASAYASKNTFAVESIIQFVAPRVDNQHHNAAKTAVSLMAMNNIYYRFVHLSQDKTFATLPAGLRMQSLSQHGIDKNTFELMSLAISAINGCGMCMDAHTKQLINEGVETSSIQSSIKIAAVIHAFAQTQFIDHC